ncbi:MAG: S1 RNA-binding domain-containing protein [Thermodesulfovibrionales bacterium]
MSDENITNSSPQAGEIVEGTGHEESFAALLEKSGSLSDRLTPGQRVKARVISVTGDMVYIDLGGKSDGVVNLSEFVDDKGVVTIKEGDEIEAYFLAAEDGMKRLTTLVRGYSSVKLNAIREAYNAGIPVEGEVKKEIKGGFEVYAGGVKCFCPFSQMDLRGGREVAAYLGETFPFKVIEFKKEGRTIVLSRRVLLEQERQARVESLKNTLSVGMVVTARVRSLQNFGAFVDLGGIDGLIPASEISWGRTENPGDVLSAGQEVTAKILSLDWESSRLTLSIKAMQADPWSAAEVKYPVGGKVCGTIVRLVPFGAFVSLEAGIDGLIHISNLGAGRRINHPKEIVEVGQQIEAYVLAVDSHARKISLSLQQKPEPKKLNLPAPGDLFEGTVDKVMPFGVFVKAGSGLSGLIPNSEMGTENGEDHGRMFPAGSPVQAVVLEVDKEKGKVLLSRKGVLAKAEQEELKRYRDSVRKEEKSSGSVGTLGEILKAKMAEKNISF